ncbi:MAG: tRNA (adenosine(37)-N6)-threonylcarbamoyltransferase complex dimerization subunit type 1 TsaB [Dysgonamonadaceae bacterium]|jgi:tRNA threonylcarbamoyladenosine biosynthesis protein TsaB|nr:tRNA (adenosine(37)-N6)-threonylcarbamoyltransferase complex dimerization subunit type 1 TsaB [Dysgonamonadaceae bacterium]
MACIIHIETSLKICSVAVSVNGEQVFVRENSQQSHSASLGVFAEEAIEILSKEGKSPEAVVVSSGPGSYTGLRIGVSLAKGLCYGLEIPLIAIPTLQIMTVGAIRELKQRGIEINATDRFAPLSDARRMEVYTAIYSQDMTEIVAEQAMIIDKNSFSDILAQRRVWFFGDGSNKCRTELRSPNAIFLENINPSASMMISLAERKFMDREFEDLAYFEPFYLKEFQATVPKNKFPFQNGK